MAPRLRGPRQNNIIETEHSSPSFNVFSLSATQTYNYALAKWCNTKLTPLSLHRYTADILEFANEICELEIASSDMLISYDVSSQFTNVHFDE